MPYIYRAEKIKEDYTYVCQDIVKEIKKYDSDPYKYFARYAGEHSVTGRVSYQALELSAFVQILFFFWGRRCLFSWIAGFLDDLSYSLLLSLL